MQRDWSYLQPGPCDLHEPHGRDELRLFLVRRPEEGFEDSRGQRRHLVVAPALSQLQGVEHGVAAPRDEQGL